MGFSVAGRRQATRGFDEHDANPPHFAELGGAVGEEPGKEVEPPGKEVELRRKEAEPQGKEKELQGKELPCMN